MSESTITIFNRTFTIKSQWKITFLATWIGGMLAHAYRFFNFLPSWDSMYNFSGTGATYSSGRCFLEFFGKISSKYDMPWVNGALSLFYLCIVSILFSPHRPLFISYAGKIKCALTAHFRARAVCST